MVIPYALQEMVAQRGGVKVLPVFEEGFVPKMYAEVGQEKTGKQKGSEKDSQLFFWGLCCSGAGHEGFLFYLKIGKMRQSVPWDGLRLACEMDGLVHFVDGVLPGMALCEADPFLFFFGVIVVQGFFDKGGIVLWSVCQVGIVFE